MVDICHWWIHHFNWATKNAPEKHPDSVMRQKAAHAVKPIDAKDISSYLPKCWLPFSDLVDLMAYFMYTANKCNVSFEF